ncbi:MAG: hypothetical protein LBC60_01295 [Spirochaetaceae bacterium]|jgi:hypothetical protein|nr:hypothetical protein [Spirochaetaceae bacterium]
MKRLWFVLVGLAITCIPAFALGRSEGDGRRDAGGNRAVAEVGDLEEVLEQEYQPRRNPNTQRAGSEVYALPATVLKPEAERLPPPVYAISGVRGQEIREGVPFPGEAVDIIIDLPESVTFSNGILEGEDVSDWIQNLPAGLVAQAHGVKKGAKSIKIYISGTPTVTMRELIRVTIPGTYLSGGRSREFVSPDEEASFNSWKEGQTAESQAQ